MSGHSDAEPGVESGATFDGPRGAEPDRDGGAPPAGLGAGDVAGRALRPPRPQVARWVGITVGALALRIALLYVSPVTTYPSDHDCFVRWGMQAADAGVTRVYDQPPPPPRFRYLGATGWAIEEPNRPRAPDNPRPPINPLCNYPPGSVYLLWVSGVLFEWLAPDRLINTLASHAAFSIWSILADFLLAWGCARLVERWRPGAGVWAYLLVLAYPPIWWDSLLWGQMDSVLLAPAVWMLEAMQRRRWLLAGVIWGLALTLKPQGVLLLPLWIYAVIVERGHWRPALGLLAAGVVFLLAGLPFNLHSGWLWLKYSYGVNLMNPGKDATTWRSYNIWYLDLLLTGQLDDASTLIGTPKRLIGTTLLAVGMFVSLVFMVFRWARDSCGYVLWASLTLLLAVMLPTRVHERYLILPLPFLLVAALLWARLWTPLALLSIVMMAQLTWPLWQSPGLDYRPGWADWIFTVLALMGTAMFLLDLGRIVPRRATAAPTRSVPARNPQ